MDDKIKDIMATVLEMDPSNIDENTSMQSVAVWDSLRHMNMIIAFEEQFNLEFEEEEIIDLMSYSALKKSIEEKL